jgi:hypothetical protein
MIVSDEAEQLSLLLILDHFLHHAEVVAQVESP